MMEWTRREIGISAVATSLALMPSVARTQAKARIVVIGGGIGGATIAKYLAASGKGVDVTIVEPKARYTTCFFSNLFLAGMRSFDSLTHGYEGLAARGIKIVQDSAQAIDSAARQVTLASGMKLPYDRLIVAPGVSYRWNTIEGYDAAAAEIIPHAWSAGSQTKLLRAQLEAMENGGVFLIVAPPNPFRCPPAPYERASLAAYYFKQFKPRSKVVILDAKDSFFRQALFQDGWNRHFPGMIEWLSATSTDGLKSVDVAARTVKTAGASFHANVVNIIPAQTAGDIARTFGLTDDTGWCPVDPTTFESTLRPGVHVVGDAAMAGDMPKSAFSANSQAKACAFAIAAALTGSERAPSNLFHAGYTYLAGDDAVSEAIRFELVQGTIKIGDASMSKLGETKERRRKTVQEAHGWYDAFTHDVFG